LQMIFPSVFDVGPTMPWVLNKLWVKGQESDWISSHFFIKLISVHYWVTWLVKMGTTEQDDCVDHSSEMGWPTCRRCQNLS
jgi:hypothetical protein